MTRNDRLFITLQCVLVLIVILMITGCAQLPTTETGQSAARDATKAAREASLYAQCRARPMGSWFDMYDDRPQIACLEWQVCLLYNNQHEAPQLPGCE